MSKKQIAIICDGKEISYGMNLLHLLRFEDTEKKVSITNESFTNYNIDIYTISAYKHSGISKSAIKVLIGSAVQTGSNINLTPIQSIHGITIRNNDTVFGITVDPKAIDGTSYDDFLSYANSQSTSYIQSEETFVARVTEYDDKWFVKTFSPIKAKGLFGGKETIKGRTQQLYDCSAYLLFMEYLKKRIPWEEE